MKRIVPNRIGAIIAILMVVLACTMPGSATETSGTPPSTETAAITETQTSSQPIEAPAIQHQIIPGDLPQERSGLAGDQNSSVTADKKKSNGGDRFSFEQFERPFNANTMDVYFPNLDILETSVYQDETWIYSTIKVVDRNAAPAGAHLYAAKIDRTNGTGDWLVLVLNPSSTDWTTNGVQIYFDANSDVGSLTQMVTDKGAPRGDGFEKVIFDQGIGEDADGAWVRVSPTDPNTVEIAVKRSLLGNPTEYLVNMWTGNDNLDPAAFDYNDYYTHEEAGAADPGFPIFYPIKALYEIDNSCRLAVGFQPTGDEPGLCLVAVGPTAPDAGSGAAPGPGPGPAPSCVPYGGSCGGGEVCCDNVPCTGGACRYP